MCFCVCSLDGKPEGHECTFATAEVAGAIVARPRETVDDWRKRGLVNARRESHGRRRWTVCVCEVGALAQTTGQRWRRRDGWGGQVIPGDDLVRTAGVR